MKKNFRLLVCVILSSSFFLTVHSQSTRPDTDTPYGSPVIKVFSNFHTELNNLANPNTAFEIQRAYLGYSQHFNNNFSGTIIFDVCQEHKDVPVQYAAYLKIAELNWKATKNLSIKAGMIGPKQFKIQEKFWEYRYILKSFQDEYKFGPSADLGIIAAYKLFNFLKVDAAFLNGEGYKNVKPYDGDFKKAFGITITPIKKINLRLYYDDMNNNSADISIDSLKNQSTYAAFLGINITDDLRFGGEYNYQIQHQHVALEDLFGYSFYTTYKFTKKLEIFTRVDYLSSNKLEGEEENWNSGKNGMGIFGGLQYAPVKGVKLALNYRYWQYESKNKDPKSFVYLNLEYKL